MGSDRIEVALAADGGYFDQLFVTATSMALNCRSDVALSFNILDGGISQLDWNYLVEKVLQVHPSSVFNRIPVDEKLFSAFPKWNGNRMAYSRLLLPSTLQNIDWILYSDCDFLWLRDVAELWQERDDNFSVVAVHDSGSWENKEASWFKNHGYKVDSEKYFCSGMCLFNLKKFRTMQLVRAASEILSAHKDVPYVDQTALNIVCAGMVKLVPQKWMCFTYQLTCELFSEPSVIHFAGEVPWKFVRHLQQLSDTMLLWHDFNARMREITIWQSLRKRFSIVQILWHRMLVWLIRFPLSRFLIQTLCSLTRHDGAYHYLLIGAQRFALPLFSRSLYQVLEDHGSDYNAGPKAPRDVAKIVTRMGARSFFVKRPGFAGTIGSWLNRLIWFFKCRWHRWWLPHDIVLFMQYPSAAWSKSPSLRILNHAIKAKKNLRIITLIHDLASFRRAGDKVDSCVLDEEEMDLFSLSDKIIVHNEAMTAALILRGVQEEKLVPLTLFDYLTEFTPPVIAGEVSNPSCSVAIAGNLNIAKSGYLHQLSQISGVQWYLYGPNFDTENIAGENIHYEGCWSPEELPSHLKGCFGLVWDGMSVETCTGAYGEYLRINNPHKLSLYLASGIPVIVWRESAVANLIETKGLGVGVESLSAINSALMKIDKDGWVRMKKRVYEEGEKIRGGIFIKKAIESCLTR